MLFLFLTSDLPRLESSVRRGKAFTHHLVLLPCRSCEPSMNSFFQFGPCVHDYYYDDTNSVFRCTDIYIHSRLDVFCAMFQLPSQGRGGEGGVEGVEGRR